MAIAGPGIYHTRRYYLLKAQAAEREWSDLKSTWWAKQDAARARELPLDFPHQSDLVALRYSTWDDIDGATAKELIAAGLARRTADAVIKLRGEKMGYSMANGRWADTEDTTPQASATKTATGTSNAIELGDRAVLRLKLDVTAASGTTPTLDVTVQGSKDGTTNWYALGTFAQKTAVSSEFKSFVADRFIRLSYTIAGTTPSFTFSVAGEAA